MTDIEPKAAGEGNCIAVQDITGKRNAYEH